MEEMLRLAGLQTAMSYFTILNAIAPIFLMIAAGWVLRARNLFTPEAEHSVAQLIIYLLYPALLFSLVIGSPAFDRLAEIAIAPFLGYGCIVGGMVAAFILAPMFGEKDEVRRRTFAFVTGIFNFGYLAIPVTQAVFDTETVTVLALFNLGVDLAIWSFGVILLTGKFTLSAVGRAFNPPTIAILSAVVLNLIGLDAYLPEFVLDTFSMIGAAAIPVGVVLIGATLCTATRGLPWASHRGTMAGAVSLRLFLIPLLFLGLAAVLPVIVEIKRVLIVQAAMPSGIFAIVIARYFQGHGRTAVVVAATTTIVGFFTIPLWIQLGLYLFDFGG